MTNGEAVSAADVVGLAVGVVAGVVLGAGLQAVSADTASSAVIQPAQRFTMVVTLRSVLYPDEFIAMIRKSRGALAHSRPTGGFRLAERGTPKPL